MKDYVVIIHDEIKIDKEKLTLNKDDEDFLLDKEHPYFGMKNKENGLLIFNIWKNIGYGIFKNNLISIIEERISYFSGSLFNNKLIRGIYLYVYNESLLLYLLGKNDKDIVPRLNDMKGKESVDEHEDLPLPPRVFLRPPILGVQQEDDIQPRENPSVTYYNTGNNNEPVDIQVEDYQTAINSNTTSASTGITYGRLGEAMINEEAARILRVRPNERDRREMLAQRDRERQAQRHIDDVARWASHMEGRP